MAIQVLVHLDPGKKKPSVSAESFDRNRTGELRISTRLLCEIRLDAEFAANRQRFLAEQGYPTEF